MRLLAGALFMANFALPAFGGQDETSSIFPSSSLTIREVSALTNAPTAATPTVVPAPALPEVTVPKPAQVDIPLATDLQSAPATQGLLLKSMQSGPAGPQERLAAIAPPPPPLTNAASLVGSPSSTNSPA